MHLPEDFIIKMKELLKDEFEDFIKSYEENRNQGLRVNTLKISVQDFHDKSPFTIKKIPWTQEGFYYGDTDRPGKHPYHEAGLYYIQEPSAMAVGEMVDPMPGEKILDLCAAPGGKTTHIAAKMNQKGFLLANEIHPARAKILSQNVERMGIRNTVVTNETPERLAQRFPGYFDRVLVDAPCSGEGMFRKDPQACEEWSLENVAMCASRQLDILKHAGSMLRPGGRLIYSTCTFSPEENEGVISKFLNSSPEFEVEDIQAYEGFDRGRADWIADAAENIEKTIRIWPHKLQGEGHFIAVLRKKDISEGTGGGIERASGIARVNRKYLHTSLDRKLLKDYYHFAEEFLSFIPEGKYVLFGEQLYIIPEEMLALENLKVVRPGWHLGTIKKNRFEPSHALGISIKGEQVKYKLNLSADSDEITAYLKGEPLEAEGPKGWYLVEVDGYSIGWGKLTDRILKNHYPKGLRWKNT
ncbi:MAG TPA: NOL1/NOP2/sun family putative RNA methylase [Clostridiaceae bacterium]|nr:NOL1/NOP2/sun family putative RNA methylase [Clostridiaceae bacterium]